MWACLVLQANPMINGWTVLLEVFFTFCLGFFSPARPDLELRVCAPQERLQAHHAPMDFSHGTGGRIISDPQEAALVAKTSIRLRSFPVSQSSSVVAGSSGGSQDLSTPPCSQTWFRPGMCREQANTALFPHRNRDGVFLIRACSRQTNNYVLSFTSNNKIVHAQIVRVSEDSERSNLA